MSADVWAPVVSAIGASALTGLVALGLDRRRDRRADRDALRDRRQAAYGRMLAAAGLIAHTAGGLHTIVELRSGLKEGVDVTTRVRKPVEPIELLDLLRRDMEPLYAAWSDVWACGTAAAVKVSNDVMFWAGGVMAAGSASSKNRSRIARFIAGEKWDDEDRAAFQLQVKGLAAARKALAELAREELGVELAELFVSGGDEGDAPASD